MENRIPKVTQRVRVLGGHLLQSKPPLWSLPCYFTDMDTGKVTNLISGLKWEEQPGSRVQTQGGLATTGRHLLGRVMAVKGPCPALAHWVSLQLLAAREGIPQAMERSAAHTGPDACPRANQGWPGGRTVADDGSFFNKASGQSQGDVSPEEGTLSRQFP